MVGLRQTDGYVVEDADWGSEERSLSDESGPPAGAIQLQLGVAAQTFLNALNDCFGPKSISLSVQVDAVGREV
jgi:hypothetical protein